jgi:NAD(P)-dependent dehydrogenase (short-subunit alcohol dehydrogenase family)
MDLGLNGDAALCTAASSGLGLASAEALAGEGADVAICGYTPEHVDDARDRLRAAGTGDVLAVQADLTDPDEVTALVEETVDAFGGIDHLVTSAGGPPSGGFGDVDDGDWYRAYDLLVMSVVWTVREAEPHLRAGDGGTITAITSRSVRQVIDDLILSNAVRRAVTGLIQSLARDFAPEVRANAVLPGSHETSRIEELVRDSVERGDAPDYETGLEEWAADIPLGGVGDPAEFGNLVAVLASDRASFVTGAELAVDGGSMRG